MQAIWWWINHSQMYFTLKLEWIIHLDKCSWGRITPYAKWTHGSIQPLLQSRIAGAMSVSGTLELFNRCNADGVGTVISGANRWYFYKRKQMKNCTYINMFVMHVWVPCVTCSFYELFCALTLLKILCHLHNIFQIKKKMIRSLKRHKWLILRRNLYKIVNKI